MTANLKQTLAFLLISFLVGILIGGMTTIFGRILLFIGAFRQDYLRYLMPFLGLAGLAIVLSYRTWGESLQKGMDRVLVAARDEQETVPLRLLFLVTLSTWLTHLFGGSAGREGVAVQIGATLAHQFETVLSIPNRRLSFIAIGIAAGFSGLFQTPLAAIFFALEMLLISRPDCRLILALIVAAFSANGISHFLGLEKFSFPLTHTLPLSFDTLLTLVSLAVLLGLLGKVFVYALAASKSLIQQRLKNPYWRILILGVRLSFLLFFLGHGRYAGLGTNLIQQGLEEGQLYPYDWVLKATLTILTLAAGFQGGEVTPLFAIGTSAGFVLAPILGLSVDVACALGYIAVFGSATHTLLAPVFIGIEVFGYQNSPAYLIMGLTIHLLYSKKSIYS